MKSPRSALAVLFLTVFLDLVGFGLVIPLLPLYAKHLGVTPAMVGPLFAIFSAMNFLFAPVWGMISDRYGRRPVLLISIFASVVGHALVASAHGPLLLFVARAWSGAATANLATAQAYIADVTTAENRARGMGMIGAAFGLGFVLGPAIAGIVSKHFGLSAPFWLASGLAVVNFVSAAALLPEPPRKRDPNAVRRRRLDAALEAFRTPHLGILLFVFFLVTFAFAKLEATFSLWLLRPPFGYDEEKVGWVFAYIGIVMSIVQGGLVGRLVPRLGEATLIKIATALMSMGLLLLPLAHSLPLLLLVILPITFGNGFNNPSTSALISRLTPPERQGEILGVAQSMSALGRIFGPPTGTLLFDHVSPNAPYWAGGAIMGATCLLAVLQVKPATRSETPVGEKVEVRGGE